MEMKKDGLNYPGDASMARSLESLTDLELLTLVSSRIRDTAFDMPPPNPHTPRFLMLADAIDNEINRRRSKP